MSDIQPSHVGIRIQIFSKEATELMEEAIKNANLPYERLALNNVQSALDSVFFFVAHRDEISWLFKSLFPLGRRTRVSMRKLNFTFASPTEPPLV